MKLPAIIDIPESTASYTLAMREDGGGVLQRTMASPGRKYGAFPSGNLEEGNVVQVEKENDQKVQTFVFNRETPMVIPIAVGHREGAKLQAIFFNTPD